MDITIPAGGIKLNVGAGRHVLDGWVNCDLEADARAPHPPELLCDAKKLPLPDCCVNELMGIHIWEHFYLWECEALIAEWRRVMMPGAKLVLELPDLFKFCENILEGRPGRRHPDQLGMWGLYGDPRAENPLLMHRWGWTFRTLRPFLEERGFEDCEEKPTEWHKVGRALRDFRLEARRV